MRQRGKKFELWDVDNTMKLEIRFDAEYSKFFAVFMDKTYENKDLNVLKKELEEVIKASAIITWTPMIQIESDSWRHRTDVFSVSKKLLGTRMRNGVEEKLIGDVYDPSGGDEEYYNNPKNMVAKSYSTYPEDEDITLIPYTIERWQAAKIVLAKLEELRDKLREVLHSDKSEKFLERVYANRDNVKLLQYDEGRIE